MGNRSKPQCGARFSIAEFDFVCELKAGHRGWHKERLSDELGATPNGEVSWENRKAKGN